MIRRLRHKWEDLKMGWRLLFGGEVAILNAIDAIHAADDQLGYMNSEEQIKRYHAIAIAHLKKVINYEDEPAVSDAVTRAELEDTTAASWLP